MAITISQYLESASSIKEKIDAIDVLINSLLVNMTSVVANAGVIEIETHDGQVRLNAEYRSVDAVLEGVRSLRKIRAEFVNMAIGRTTVLRSRRNF